MIEVNKSRYQCLWRKSLACLLYILCTWVLYFSGQFANPQRSVAVVLLCFSASMIGLLEWHPGWRKSNVYRSGKDLTMILLISVYSSLASFGQRFFLNGNTRMHFSMQGFVCCLLGIIWFIPVVQFLLVSLERISDFSSKKKRLSRRKAYCLLLTTMVACQGFVMWVLWPGGHPRDTIFQLSQVAGIIPLNDWHPVIHTLAEWAILQIIPNTGAIMAVQMLAFSWLLTSILMLGYDRGVTLPLLAAVGVIIEILPNQALTGCNLLKDYPFTLALIWGGYLLFHLLNGTNWSHKVSFYVCLCVDIFLVFTLRHNGIIPAAFMILACVILTIRYFTRIQWRAVAAVAASLVSLVIYKGSVMAALDVQPNDVSPYTTMLCAVGSCINKDLPLSDEATAIMEEVLPLEDWAEYYSRYLGHDPYFWGRPEGSVAYDTSSITAKKAFRVYLEALIKYPDVIIKDRLDGMDIMWDIVQPVDGFNSRAFFFIDSRSPQEMDLPIDTTGWTQYEGGVYFKETTLAMKYQQSNWGAPNTLEDILIWRSGPYLVVFLVLLLFWAKHNMMEYLLVAAPLVGNIFASMLLVYHQSFRYVWFVQILVLMLVFLTIIQAKQQEQRDA